MSDCASKAIKELYDAGEIHGIVTAGGSGGTSLAAPVMRDVLPIGFPKLIVSTIASGDTGPIVGETDIAMLYSVVDVAGLNQVLRDILSNAGAFIAAAAASFANRTRQAPASSVGSPKKRIGITMFGVTTPGVDAIRKHLDTKGGIETYVFHATGHGGKSMERLVREGALDAVLDLTTTEICDLLNGGNMSAGPDRLNAAAEAGVPYLVSLGATDMTNFGPRNTVPEKYKDRLLYEHNPVVTLMRSSEEECRHVGQFISTKLKRFAKRHELVQVWIPRGGVSMISTPGAPFADPEADEALFSAVRAGLERTGIEVIDDPRDVNDAGFARDIAEALLAKMSLV
ncbi:putative upf0261 domain-containing protein [Phaeoacremonium minimum UCRPA7]|uniref:Putative upf0261 domain-containing protein n=1 Tax=Phaeoacremonium minimum (strain UCR-PA7) TaxID=1286976 RepID=R8BEL1_PHAM7|nr:putative upf0261 domain-containing protein [Phaeoacremonium minimum UCRPA7]EON97725.1 putative upf0261 domain-containing protein [Phaeoacremonium minimum UCRPA7]